MGSLKNVLQQEIRNNIMSFGGSEEKGKEEEEGKLFVQPNELESTFGGSPKGKNWRRPQITPSMKYGGHVPKELDSIDVLESPLRKVAIRGYTGFVPSERGRRGFLYCVCVCVVCVCVCVMCFLLLFLINTQRTTLTQTKGRSAESR